MHIWSFNEIGSPCKGPTTLPVAFRCSSSSVARANARSTKISVKQFTYTAPRVVRPDKRVHERSCNLSPLTSWCATIARL